MATITSLNQYKASYADSTDMSVAASSLADAIVALAEAKEGEPSLIQRVVTGIKVAIPAPAIAIKTLVTGTGAEASGCKATPYNISSVENGDKVWFTAIVAEGYAFSGWYLNDELQSSDESYEATISYAGTTPTTLEYEARFVVQ
jgi:glycine cleavage system pyridoxal-binding protein P